MKSQNRLDVSQRKSRVYYVFSFVVVFILAFLFAFPLYWIITGSFKTKQDIMSTTPVWRPSVFTSSNFDKLMSSRSAPLFDLKLFGYVITGPTVPAAMAGSALASVPIIIVFLIFQKYFTKGITMGAVKG